MDTKPTKTIDIYAPSYDFQKVTIVGTTPLIVHNWDDKAKQMMLDKQMGKAKKKGHEIKVPVNDFMNSLYWLSEKPKNGETSEEAESIWIDAVKENPKFGFRLDGIKKSIASGAYRSGVVKDKVSVFGSFFIEGATDSSTPDLAEIIGPVPEMREDMVRVGNGSADIRYRAEFKHWKIPLIIKCNARGKYSLEQILDFFNLGGFACGIGEWRPEKSGQFGMYEVEV